MIRHDTHSMAGTLPAIFIPAGDYSRLVALAEAAGREAPQLRDYLGRELDRARIVDEAAFDDQVVRLGSHVTYRDNTDGRERTVQLVWPLEADVGRQRISVISLVGAALLGMRAGQAIDWPGPLGDARRLEVLAVHQQRPDAAA